ncbi:probable prefoldin subunit 2 [Contarinia nasturtii]|uniref:probable prefoldin subunit 2 n=1 Tax=Contarinia nasturtii TaxID=265458 RepID=UPI0012D42B19|nr:probable prefoldin subunit 2 [Contarinia nasturtii]
MAAESSKTEREHAKILNDLQALRNEQRNIVSNISTLELDLKEHKTVIDTLKSVDEDRKCFRLIGGVLCERTVKSVLPQLNDAKEQLEKLIAQRQEQLTSKGVEINKFREKHNIKIKGEGSPGAESSTAGRSEENRNHVLVAN